MCKASWGIVGLLIITSCGGAARDPAQDVEDSAVASDSSADSCEEVNRKVYRVIDNAKLSAPATCSDDSECQLFFVYSDCAFRCGLDVAVTDATGIQAAIETANGLCREECRGVPPPCGGSYDVEATARCSAGKCVVVAGR
jgi:hypothetical protein